MQDRLEFASHLADESGAIIRRYFRQPFDVDRKGDATPVTVADRAAEECLRALIEKECPDDGILGEEFGIKESRTGFVWVLDPIDGTKSFVIGRPVFGTLIALCENDIPIVGVIDQPVLRERWTGCGDQAFFNGERIKTRACPTLAAARIGCTDPRQLTAAQADRLAQAANFMVWGGDCYMYGLLAGGGLDVIVETGLAPYDLAALVPVIQGAGGLMTDWNGAALTLRSDGRIVAAGNPMLLQPIQDLLQEE